MQLRRLGKPELPVSLDIIKRHCRVDASFTVDDELLILIARAAIERGQDLTGKVWPETEFAWSGFVPDAAGSVILPRSPAIAASVSYVDGNGETQPFTGFSFAPSTLLPNSCPQVEVWERDPWDAVLQSSAWPESAVITFTAGWGDADWPEVFTQWTLIKTAAKYAQREDLAQTGRYSLSDFPPEFCDNMLNPYKRIVRM